MGISSDGILYFGFVIAEDDDVPAFLEDIEDHNFELFLIKEAGMSYEDNPYEEREKMIESCPADIGLYCSYEYSEYILMVRGCEFRVNRGYTQEITPEMLIVAPEKIAAFKDWCESHNIEYKEPKWLLCSMYG